MREQAFIGWCEFTLSGVNTTHIAYVHEDGSIYLPETDITEADFHLSAARGLITQLVPAVAVPDA